MVITEIGDFDTDDSVETAQKQLGIKYVVLNSIAMPNIYVLFVKC